MATTALVIDYLAGLVAAAPLYAVGFAAACYGLGAIPVGLVLTRLAGLGDIRQIGSGNIGATNVLRTGNRWVALATLLLDLGKGALAAWLMIRFWNRLFTPQAWAPLVGFDDPAAALAAWTTAQVTCGVVGTGLAVLGHCFSPFLRLRGGKGVSAALGGLLMAAPAVGVVALMIWLQVAMWTAKSSAAALTALGTVVALLAAFQGGWLPALLWVLVMVVIVWRHRANIARLRAGQEPDIQLRRRA